MGIFNINQQPKALDVYIIPDGDLAGCTDYTPFGGIPNYTCIDDPVNVPDDDATYVFNDTISLLSDLYTLPNQTLTGTINYVQVFARAKSHILPQASAGLFKILISPDGTCTDEYASDDINLITSYHTYSNIWTTNPTDGAVWNWGNIKLLCIGVLCNSPSNTQTLDLILRPNAVGDATNLTPVGDNPNWKCVDETVPDDDATYVSTTALAQTCDLYNIPNHTTEHGLITGLTIFTECKSITGEGTSNETLKTGGGQYTGAYHELTQQYAIYSRFWDENPNTTNPWTWAEIDALQIGVCLNAGAGGNEARCTQVYAKVSYLTDFNPEIRTTQVYAKINYTPDEIDCTMQKPNQISTNHTMNIKMLNFWSGNRAVYSLNRSGKSMVLTGTESKNSCTRIQCVRDAGENGAKVTVSGLGSILWDATYYIRSFGWKHISECPDVYTWILELEDTRHVSGDESYA